MSSLKPEVRGVGVAANRQQLQVRQSDPRHLTTGTSVLCNMQRYKPISDQRDGQMVTLLWKQQAVTVFRFIILLHLYCRVKQR